MKHHQSSRSAHPRASRTYVRLEDVEVIGQEDFPKLGAPSLQRWGTDGLYEGFLCLVGHYLGSSVPSPLLRKDAPVLTTYAPIRVIRLTGNL